MTRAMTRLVSRFRRDESGNATIEFVVVFPIFMFLIMAGTELAMISARQVMLERAVDMTVREIRLGTGQFPQHDEIKDMVCDNAALLPTCSQTLRLEMVRVDVENWVPLDPSPDCVDISQPVEPVREFTHGGTNDLMILRVCAKFKPFFPTSRIANDLSKDGGGYISVSSTTAFVQEPS